MLERILDVKTKKLRSKIIGEFKSKWMDKSIQDATWNEKKLLQLTSLTFYCKSPIFKEGDYVMGMNINYPVV